jgi:hypothetical protein
MEPHCSFCGKIHAEVEKLIAGPSVLICNECVRLCADILDDPASLFETRQDPDCKREVWRGLLPTGVAQVLIRLPDGTVHAAAPTTPWRPLVVVVFGEKLEWCAAHSLVSGSTPLLVVAVRKRGAEGPAVGAAFGIHVKPTRGHAKEIALKYLLGRK